MEESERTGKPNSSQLERITASIRLLMKTAIISRDVLTAAS